MNFFDPRTKMDDGRLYTQLRYDQIIEEQVAISYATKGGISISDTDEMCPYDRERVLKAIQDIRKSEADAQSSALGNISNRSTSRFR